LGKRETTNLLGDLLLFVSSEGRERVVFGSDLLGEREKDDEAKNVSMSRREARKRFGERGSPVRG